MVFFVKNYNKLPRISLGMPAIMLGASVPSFAALYSIQSLQGRSAVRPFLRTFLFIRFGWKVWLIIRCITFRRFYRFKVKGWLKIA